MKTITIFVISMLIAVFAFGQEQKVEEVEVTAPQYAGIKNPAAMQGVYPNTLIKKYLSENIVYPEEALTCNIEGTEVVKFTVTIEGNVKDFKIVNSVCPEIDKEVILTLELTNGMWYPGIKNGKPAEMEIEIPFTFYTSTTNSKLVHEIFTEKAATYFSKGNEMLLAKKNAKKAITYYNEGLKYLPYDAGLLFSRGICRFELGDKEGAIEDWTRLHDLNGPDMSKYIAQLKDMNGYDEMLAILKK